MALDAKKHTSPAAGEVPSRAALAAMIFSADDIVPVANTTEANQVAAAVASAGQVLASSPVFVSRADARGLHRIEYTYDGTTWLPFSGILTFASKAAADTFASTSSALLTAGDICMAGGVEHMWTGTAWSPHAGGVFRLTPSAVTGAGVTIGADGAVILSAVAASAVVQIQGIFSALFKNYQVRATFASKVSGAYQVQGIIGSTPAGGTAYSRTYQSFFGGSGRSDQFATGMSNFGEAFIPLLGSGGAGTADILSPNAAEPTFLVSQCAHVGGITGVMNLSAALNSTDQLTGLQITCPAGATTTGEIRIYGVA